MAKLDLEKTARNKVIDSLTAELRGLSSAVLSETGISSEQSLNGIYGGKFDVYIDIKNEVIHSPQHFIALYLEGFVRKARASRSDSANPRNLETLKASPKLQEYLFIFLQRVYLRKIDALSKKRPKVEDAAIWIGQSHAEYGLLVAPRVNRRTAQWENDKSEIRHFEPLYWSIGHVLQTGLVVPRQPDLMSFATVDDYLNFFVNVLVRNSGSKYEYALANKYRQYVRSTPEPTRVPLLIPELRYEGATGAHRYRLDFTVIDPHELTKVAFELSPWSTHGYLSSIKGLTQAKINSMAQDNFEKEMRKHKDFFRRQGIFTLIYTDKDLADLDRVFSDIKRFLEPKSRMTQLRFHIVQEILGRTA